jgi:hypothetical protein
MVARGEAPANDFGPLLPLLWMQMGSLKFKMDMAAGIKQQN